MLDLILATTKEAAWSLMKPEEPEATKPSVFHYEEDT